MNHFSKCHLWWHAVRCGRGGGRGGSDSLFRAHPEPPAVHSVNMKTGHLLTTPHSITALMKCTRQLNEAYKLPPYFLTIGLTLEQKHIFVDYTSVHSEDTRSKKGVIKNNVIAQDINKTLDTLFITKFY